MEKVKLRSLNFKICSKIAIIALASTVTACDWVDSAGEQGVDASGQTAFVSPPVVVQLDGSSNGETIVVNEQDVSAFTATSAVLSGGVQTYSLVGEPLAQGNLPECNFSTPEYVASTFADACTSDTVCAIRFEDRPEKIDSDVLIPHLLIPAVKSSVGVRYTLRVEDTAAEAINQDSTFCITAINDAPEVTEQNFTVFEGENLNITLDDKHLLSDVSDDEDLSNEPLSIVLGYTDPVNGQPLDAPEFADDFVLNANGSFLYRSRFINLRGQQLDDFQFAVTDGTNVSIGKVTIKIITRDEAPVQDEEIPFLQATQGKRFSFDFADFFSDTETADLDYRLSSQLPLVENTGLSLSEDGVLEGVPTQADVGSYQLLLKVTDGANEIQAQVTLEVSPAAVLVENKPPVYVQGTLRSQDVFIDTFVSVQAVFNDPDGDNLSYKMVGTRVLPRGVRLNANTGVISGTPRELGRFVGLQVQATDTAGNTANSLAFRLTVKEAI